MREKDRSLTEKETGPSVREGQNPDRERDRTLTVRVRTLTQREKDGILRDRQDPESMGQACNSHPAPIGTATQRS